MTFCLCVQCCRHIGAEVHRRSAPQRYANGGRRRHDTHLVHVQYGLQYFPARRNQRDESDSHRHSAQWLHRARTCHTFGKGSEVARPAPLFPERHEPQRRWTFRRYFPSHYRGYGKCCTTYDKSLLHGRTHDPGATNCSVVGTVFVEAIFRDKFRIY